MQCAVCSVWCLESVRQVAVCSVRCAVPRECATGGGRVTVPAGDLDIAPTRSHKARIAVHRLKYAAPPQQLFTIQGSCGVSNRCSKIYLKVVTVSPPQKVFQFLGVLLISYKS